MMASPTSCCHHDSVCLSNMIMSLCRRTPDTPKSSVRSPSRRSKVMAELHSGQYVTATGTSLKLSLTISCQMRMANG